MLPASSLVAVALGLDVTGGGGGGGGGGDGGGCGGGGAAADSGVGAVLLVEMQLLLPF